MKDERVREGKKEGYGIEKEVTVTVAMKREEGWNRSGMWICR